MGLGIKTGFYRYDEASSETDNFDLVGEVQEISGLDMSADSIEDTPYGPDEDDWRKYSAGMKDAGEVTVKIRAKTGNKTALEDIRADFIAGVDDGQYRLRFPAPISKNFTFGAVITKCSMPTTKDQHIDLTFTFKISGKPVESAVVV